MNLETFNSLRKTVETEKGTVGYAEIGEGPPAVFVHGLFVSSYIWRDVIEQLADERRCIAYDLPGHGFSPPQPDQDLSLQGNASILEALCQALELEDIDLVANDTGGAVAQVFAVRRPDLLRSLTLTNCEARDVLPANDPLPELARQLADQGELVEVILQATDMEFAKSELGLAAGTQYHDRFDDEMLQGYFAPHSTSEEGAREVQRFLQSIDRQQLVEIMSEVRKLEVPTMMVWGTGDRFFTLDLAYWLKDNVPGAGEVVEIEGGTLFWPGERPDDLAPHLRRHWAATRETEPMAAD
jgi:pimeloyl-ACP methyl ester carboxylesterase